MRRKKKRPALHVLTSGLVVTKRRAKQLNHAPFSASHPADSVQRKSPGNLARDIAKAKVKAVSPMLKRLKAARVAASPKGSFDRSSRVSFAAGAGAASSAVGSAAGAGAASLRAARLLAPARRRRPKNPPRSSGRPATR